jgi:hypothetical protein
MAEMPNTQRRQKNLVAKLRKKRQSGKVSGRRQVEASWYYLCAEQNLRYVCTELSSGGSDFEPSVVDVPFEVKKLTLGNDSLRRLPLPAIKTWSEPFTIEAESLRGRDVWGITSS